MLERVLRVTDVCFLVAFCSWHAVNPCHLDVREQLKGDCLTTQCDLQIPCQRAISHTCSNCGTSVEAMVFDGTGGGGGGGGRLKNTYEFET